MERDELMLHHPATPLLPEDRPLFEGLPLASYDPDWRFELPILPADPGGFDFATGTDGVVPFERIGRVEIPDAGSLDVWRLTTYGGGLFIPVRDALAGREGGTYGRRPLSDRHDQGRRPGIGCRRRHDRARLQLRLQPVLRVRPRPGRARSRSTGNVLDVPVPVGEMY